jgi:hypothetical protein
MFLTTWPGSGCCSSTDRNISILELMAISISSLSLRPPCYSHVNIPFHNSTPRLDLSIRDYRAALSTAASTVLGPGTTMLVLSSTSTTGATTGHETVVSGSCREVIVSWLQVGHPPLTYARPCNPPQASFSSHQLSRSAHRCPLDPKWPTRFLRL